MAKLQKKYMVFVGLLLGLALALSGVTPALAAKEVVLRGETLGAGSVPAILLLRLSGLVKKNNGYRIQIATGQAITKVAIKAAMGKVDLMTSAPSVSYYMKNQIFMYKKIKDSKELVKNIRSIVNYPFGVYHLVVWDDSGIKNIAELKGKRLFVGPPGSSAGRTTTAMLKATADLEPGIGYSPVKLGWNGGFQAFQDRQAAFYAVPTPIPSAKIQQLAAIDNIRFLGISEKTVQNPLIQKILEVPGRAVSYIPVGAYGKKQANTEPVMTIASWGVLDTNKFVSAEIIYNITKTFWENIDQIYEASPGLKAITKETGIKYLATPLHIGAYRYYKEAGFNIPENAIPPEVK
ncbi:MAG: TAXI family TRAP transporter solute-binding subunit [Proteobacteria bacterium]|nr:TAXI family TRAP transporter solute-binding subunit [Pseudomonadota bacterium]MBU4383926.1 TAXI family TRAP transporter solute-binding subunit [Pseudomonadota bacterium]MCG2763566.1 TAXI family TRAP transporter solute-binding subunit [Desulfarculaceae bacterium]